MLLKYAWKLCKGNHILITFASKSCIMTIREWIKNREISGIQTFSYDELISSFKNYSEQIVKNELYRLSTQKMIFPVYKSFYAIIPPQYAAKGIVPPLYYIDQLMTFLRKPYYISLMNAAELLGAAHQRPQNFSVTTIFPKSTVSSSKNSLLSWLYRKRIPTEYLLTKNSETGTVTYSNAELTAIDLVQYEQYIGGLSRAATILEELIEQTDFSKVAKGLLDYTSVATVQRLGYVLDEILDEKAQADILFQQLFLYVKRLNYVTLSTRHPIIDGMKNKRWKININLKIEIDDI